MNWDLLFNFGFPAVLCIYLLFFFGKKIDKLDKTISNDLTHALEKNTDATEKNSESGGKVERVLEKLDNSIDRLINKL